MNSGTVFSRVIAQIIKSGPLRKTLRAMRQSLRLSARRIRWSTANRHNESSVLNLFDLEHVEVGRYTYGRLCVIDGNGPSRLRIGDFCSIADDVVFVLNGEHRMTSLLTFPLATFVLGQRESALSRGDIVVADDVWIGHGAIILSGVSIGRGSVIAAGSVVVKDVPSFAICAGVPARQVGTRFSEPVRMILKDLDYSKINAEFVECHLELLEKPITEATLSELRHLLSPERSV